MGKEGRKAKKWDRELCKYMWKRGLCNLDSQGNVTVRVTFE